MELLLTCAGVALVIVAFAVSDYLEAKAKAASAADDAQGESLLSRDRASESK